MERLLKKILERSVRVVVVGMGYVGLPLAVEMARRGLTVVGYDVDEGKIEALKKGQSYIPDVPSSVLGGLLQAGKLLPTTDVGELARADVVSICVPTPLNKTREPDISFVMRASEAVAEHLRPGMLVVLESTTWPGTTADLLLPLFEGRGLKVGVDFSLCFSPERVDPGNRHYGIRNTPKVVGGITPRCTDLGRAFYGIFIERVVPVSSTQVAEMVKILENTFRAVNIALVNEVALICHKLGIDSWEVIDAAATKPFGFMPFYPGPGLGGHCIPVDPQYLQWILRTVDYNARFIELASEINRSMPEHVVERVGEALNDARKAFNGSRLLVLGVAYKRDIDDVRESPALDIIALLEARKAHVDYHDPHVHSIQLLGRERRSVPIDEALLRSYDGVVIVTDHSSIDYDRVVECAGLVVDTRNATRASTRDRSRVYRL